MNKLAKLIVVSMMIVSSAFALDANTVFANPIDFRLVHHPRDVEFGHEFLFPV